jgi:hypothetical protein
MKTSFSIIARNIRIAAQAIVRAYLSRSVLQEGVVIPAHNRRIFYSRTRQRYVKHRR